MNDDFSKTKSGGEVIQMDILDKYIKKIFSLVDISTIKPMKVVVDTGNGMGGLMIPKIKQKISKCEWIHIFPELDGTFPNHEANPLKKENMVALQKAVLEHEADVGIAYDGDGDRIGFVDEKGEIVSGDFIIALIAGELLKNHQGDIILYDLRSSNSTKEAINEAGGKPEMCRVGHSLIKRMMKETGALFAGELSSHFYYRDFYRVESTELTSLLVLKLISESGKTFSELVRPLRKYYQSGEINSDVEDKQAKIKELEEKYKEGAASISHLDGVRIDFSDWWFNARPSNTEAKLRLNLEAKTKELMEEKRDELLKIIRK